MKRRDASGGFTLVELLVVIAIIGLLASIIIASISSAQVKARDAKRIADMHDLQNALELFVDTCGTYPLISPLTLTDNGGGRRPSGVTLATVIGTLPTDPGASGAVANYLYTALGSGGNSCTMATSYHLGALLEARETPGFGILNPGSAVCKGTGGTVGNYKGGSGNGTGNTIAATNGDFQGCNATNGCTQSQWVYDLTP